jgi:Leucine-rich repeat (LRR) protein
MLVRNLQSARVRAERSEIIVNSVRHAAPQFSAEAATLIEEGALDQALQKLSYAIALQPDVAAHHVLRGHIFESMLRLDAAEAAYARALDLDPSNESASENRLVCSRVLSARDARAPANLYALHRVMMKDERHAEALRMAQRLSSDKELLFRTWSAVLARAGFPSTLELNADGTFSLNLSGTAVTSLAILKGMPLVSLDLSHTDVTSLSSLAGLPLQRLNLEFTRVDDLTVLKGMPLEYLNLGTTQVISLTALEGMPLKELNVEQTPVSSFAPLRNMPLQVLKIGGTRVRDFDPLRSLPLRELDATRTALNDLGPLQALPLERLNLDGAQVTDLSPLHRSPLKVLDLSHTAISSLGALRGMPLEKLFLAGCRNLTDLTPLSECALLEQLVIPAQCSKVAFLQALPTLRFISYEKGDRNPVYDQTAQEFWIATRAGK